MTKFLMCKKMALFEGIKEEFKYTIVGVIVSSFTFVIAFAWRDVIQAAFDSFITKGEELRANLIYTVIVTAIGAVAIYFLHKWTGKDHKELVE